MKSLCIVLLCILMQHNTFSDPVAIIVSKNTLLSNITVNEVQDIYYGKIAVLSNGLVPLPIDYCCDNELRDDFYRKLLGKSLSKMTGYWSTLVFTGQVTPPRQLPSVSVVIYAIQENPTAIGFSYLAPVKNRQDVKILYILP